MKNSKAKVSQSNDVNIEDQRKADDAKNRKDEELRRKVCRF